jgi:RNA polymerase sigma-70 factor (ECF subfamily)
MPVDRSAGEPAGPAGSHAADLESTARLLERARAGEQDAFDRLVARHATALRRWARGRLPKWARDMADTDDVIQDTLLQTFKRIDHFEVRGPGALQAYLREAVHNRIRDELRRKGRRPLTTELDGLEINPGQSPLEAAMGGEAVARYEHALATLSVDEREAIIGRIEMGYSYKELADALGKPSAEAARKAAQRALMRLVRQMNTRRQ